MDTYFPTSAWTALDPSDVGVTRFLNVHLQGNLQVDDSRTIAFGNSGITDAYIKFDGAGNLTFYDSTVAAAKTLSQLVAAAGSTLDAAFDGGATIDGAVSSATAMQVGGTNDKILLYENANNDVRIGTTAGATLSIIPAGGTTNFQSTAITGVTTFSGTMATLQGIRNTVATIDTSADIELGNVGNADNVKITFGADGSTDAYIKFDGTDLLFFDSHLGTTVKLVQMAGGVLTAPAITGVVTWTAAADAIEGTWTFSNVANDGIDILANSMTSANLVHAKSTSVSSGTLVLAESVDATMTTGSYFRAYNGAADVFKVKRYGAITCAGNAATDILTITAGDVQVDNGKIELDTTQDIYTYFKRNNATGTAASVLVWQAHVTGGNAFKVDQDATGDVDAMVVDNAGTGFAITTTGAAAGSRGYEFISAASGTGPGFLADGTTGGAAWVGAAGTGLIQAQSDGALANVAASLLYLAYSGNAGGANQTGSCINVVETGTASGTSYAVGISSASNNGMNIAVSGVAKTNLVLTGVASQTAKVLSVGGTTWIGAAATGMLHVAGSGALADVAASLCYIAYSGNAAGANQTGSCINVVETGAASGTSYAVGISSASNQGMRIETKAAAGVNLTCICGTTAAQTGNQVYLDGSTGNGYVGAAGTGVLKIVASKAFASTTTSCLNITNSATGQAATMGGSLRIVDTAAYGGAGNYAVYISANHANTEAMYIDDGILKVDETCNLAVAAGNLNVGVAPTARATTEPVGAINLVNGTAPVGAAANTVTLYAAAGELRVMDAGGNSTLLSPHDDDGYWVYDSVDTVSGKHVHIDMERFIVALAAKFPDELAQFVTIS